MHGVSVILSFQISTTQSTDALEHWMTGFFESFHHLCGDGISFSFRCVIESFVPLVFVSRAEECPVSSREFLLVILDFFGFEMRLSGFVLFVHSNSMSLNIDMTMIRPTNF